MVVSAELVDARNNRSLWGESYEGKLSDVLRVQREITADISAHLREKLTREQMAHVTKSATADPEAYEWYLKGRYYWEQRTPEGLEKARDFFNQAIARDPKFAQAYVGLADYWAVAPDFLRVALSESLPNEKAAALKALALDNDSPGAHLALANAYWDNWEWANAEREFQRTLELDPKFANGHHWYGLSLSWLGRHQEAIAHLQRAVELDPTNLHYKDNLGEGYQNARQYDRALEQLNTIVAIDPNFAIAYGELGDLYRALGKYDLWLLNWKKKAALNKNPYRVKLVDQLSQAYAAGGYPAAVHCIIELQKQQLPTMYVDPANVAYEYAALGNKDEAFRWLQRAYAERSRALQWIQVERSMDALRSDPRYVDLLRLMGMWPRSWVCSSVVRVRAGLGRPVIMPEAYPRPATYTSYLWDTTLGATDKRDILPYALAKQASVAIHLRAHPAQPASIAYD
jgi:tetratricopeptide (TPR) repeat protein